MNTHIASPSRFKRFPSISAAFLLIIKHPDKKQLKGEGVFFLAHVLDRVHHGEEAGHITWQQKNREQCQGHLSSTWDLFIEMVRPAFRWIFPLQLTYLRKSLRERPWTNLISYPESLPQVIPDPSKLTAESSHHLLPVLIMSLIKGFPEHIPQTLGLGNSLVQGVQCPVDFSESALCPLDSTDIVPEWGQQQVSWTLTNIPWGQSNPWFRTTIAF